VSERTFPVLWQWTRVDGLRATELGCPREVPWAFIGECHAECQWNHSQTPERLAERGGLGPEEMLAVRALFDAAREGRTLTREQRHAFWTMKPDESVPKLKAALEAWLLSPGRETRRES